MHALTLQSAAASFSLSSSLSLTATFPDGATYDGHYKNGLREGAGKYTFAGGKGFYSGEWVAGERQGVGTNTKTLVVAAADRASASLHVRRFLL